MNWGIDRVFHDGAWTLGTFLRAPHVTHSF